MTIKTKSNLKTENGNTVYENQSGEVKADKLNTLLDNIIDSLQSEYESYRTITSSDSLQESDDTLFVDASGGNVTVTLLDPTSSRSKIHNIKKIDGTANTVTFSTPSGTIEFGNNIDLASQGDVNNLQHDGTNWYLVS